MALTPGTRLGPYEIVSALGAGGMGEVYKARDTRLDRTVAIKVLPEHVASDPELKQRFEREAKTISSLNHPHICTLYDVGNQDGVDFLVMEHLEGETLAQRPAKGALPLDQALKTAIEIADALDKAHRQGITHRDLKPGNIMLTKTGAKLLDFGLAKLRPAGAPGAVGLSEAPTISSPLTGAGTILGTFQYMAPEQLEGQEADARTDIFAFGAVVYEMVTGRKAFEGKSQASLIAAILEREPPALSSLEPMTPVALNYAVTVCLGKDPDDRWQTARDLLRELKRVETGTARIGISPRVASRWRLSPLRAAVLGSAMTFMIVWGVLRLDQDAGVLPVTRLSVPLAGQQLALEAGGQVALSPDGTLLAYAANDQLYLRPLAEMQATAISGTEDAQDPLFSPDGQWIGFWRAGRLHKISVNGGAVIQLSAAPDWQGATWGQDDAILFARFNAGVLRVAGTGGEPEVLIPLSADEGIIRRPQMLPGGEAVLFTFSRAGRGAWDRDAQVVAEVLRTGERRVLVPLGMDARYLPTGHLAYMQERTVFVVPFDPERLEVTGPAVPLIENVSLYRGSGVVQFATSSTGTLVYVPLTLGGGSPTLTWVDRDGGEEPVAGVDGRSFEYPRLSPAGSRIAIGIRGVNTDLWIHDVARGGLSRLTFDPGEDETPLWTPDGQSITYAATRGTARLTLQSLADGSGEGNPADSGSQPHHAREVESNRMNGVTQGSKSLYRYQIQVVAGRTLLLACAAVISPNRFPHRQAGPVRGQPHSCSAPQALSRERSLRRERGGPVRGHPRRGADRLYNQAQH